MNRYMWAHAARLLVVLTLPLTLTAYVVPPEQLTNDLVTQLFEIAPQIPDKRHGNPKGRAEIHSMIHTHKRALISSKKKAIKDLSADGKEVFFEHLSEMLLDKRLHAPFKIPSKASHISQMDAFLYLTYQLMDGDAHYHAIRPVLLTCIGETSMWKISGKLAKPSFRHLIPDSLAKKIFGLNIKVLAELKPVMEQRMKSIAATSSASVASEQQAPSYTEKIQNLLFSFKAWLLAKKSMLYDAKKILLEKIKHASSKRPFTAADAAKGASVSA